MNKPNWKRDLGGGCQWPRCRQDGGTHFRHGATKWINLDEGVDLCDEHISIMNDELFSGPIMPHEVGTQVWLAEMEDWPREQVWIRDWFVKGEGGISLLVSNDAFTPLDDCQEVDLEMIES